MACVKRRRARFCHEGGRGEACVKGRWLCQRRGSPDLRGGCGVGKPQICLVPDSGPMRICESTYVRSSQTKQKYSDEALTLQRSFD